MAVGVGLGVSAIYATRALRTKSGAKPAAKEPNATPKSKAKKYLDVELGDQYFDKEELFE